MKINFYIVVIALFVLSACAPMRYANQSQSASNAPSSYASLGSGGSVKHGKPYQVAGKWYYPLDSNAQYSQVGIASWYGKKFHGRKTANGETYNMYAMTAAHTTLPMPSLVLVTNLDNGKSVKVRVNDRGPFVKGRLIDLSYAAAKALGYAKQGTARVRVQTLNAAEHSVSKQQVNRQHVLKPQLVKPIQQSAIQHEPKMAYVQVGAFAEHDNALGVVGKLQTHLDANHPPLKVVNIGHVYRVRVGPFDLDEDAEHTLSLIQNKGYSAAMIIHGDAVE
ncbi:septal ring lytic transglycosylase RlpA family protein [Ghiorsea bivora]|uniref:septal ring lytic transglycosylase RlpA family protein n=1 Tax=Ghiorsea bivora TaxID=1485545 RepID=UPI00069184C1|nr:septal ring lytic transglycosylase RlpA family protein [Ghiorsea bivora]